jgi:acyl-CoA thioester hydrolase
MGSWHESNLRVRFEETDTMGVVYYSKFLVWMEVGRINLLRDIGIVYGDLLKRGRHIPVVQAHADYKAFARFDNEVLVKTRVAAVGRRSVRFENEIIKLPEKELLCTGHTVHAYIDNDAKSCPVPQDLRRKLAES